MPNEHERHWGRATVRVLGPPLGRWAARIRLESRWLLDRVVQLGPRTVGEAALEAAAGLSPHDTVYRSRTRTDVGMWMRGGRVLACARDGALLLLAHGKLPYRESIPFAELGESRYNHVTGALVLAPATGARVRDLNLPPLEADALLAMIKGYETDARDGHEGRNTAC